MSYEFYITPQEYAEAERNGISRQVLSDRVRKLGWKKQRAMTTPARKMTKRKHWAEIAATNGINYSTFSTRVNTHGMSMEEAATRPLQDPREAIKIADQYRHKRLPREWIEKAKENGISRKTLYQRITRYHWDIETAATKPPMSYQEMAERNRDFIRY